MLSEYEVTRRWRAVFQGGNVTDESLDVAQGLIDELSFESPLRVRLSRDLDEIRNSLTRHEKGRSKRTTKGKLPRRN